ncbi:uncharacterized protein LOC144624967 [Crassostrea virginica]
MANFTKEDSHFVVFFDVDKSLQTLPKSRIGGQLDESEKVTVLWKTSKMLEDGTEVVGDMPYDGIVVFSGSDENLTDKDTTMAQSPKKIETPKKTVQTQTPKKTKKKATPQKATPKKTATTTLTTPTIKETPPKKLQRATPMKNSNLKATTASTSPIKKTASTTPTKKATPQKATPKKTARATTTLTTPTIKETSPKKVQRAIPMKNSKLKATTALTSPIKKSASTTPTKKATPQKATPKKTARATTTLTTPTVKATPAKKLQKATPLKTFKATMASTTPRKIASSLKNYAQISTPEKTPRKKLPSQNITSTPKETVGMCHLQQSPESTTNISNIIGSSLDVLNHENEEQEFFAYPETSFEPTDPVGEFGYNDSHTFSPSNFPLQPLIDYYGSLPFDAQTQILSFCHVLTNTLHQCTYGPQNGQSGQEMMACQTSTEEHHISQ